MIARSKKGVRGKEVGVAAKTKQNKTKNCILLQMGGKFH